MARSGHHDPNGRIFLGGPCGLMAPAAEVCCGLGWEVCRSCGFESVAGRGITGGRPRASFHPASRCLCRKSKHPLHRAPQTGESSHRSDPDVIEPNMPCPLPAWGSRRRVSRGISAIRRRRLAATWLKALNPDLDPIRRAAGAIQAEQAGVPVEIGTDLALFVVGTDEAQIEIAEFVKRQTDASIALSRQQSFRHKWMRELHPEARHRAFVI